MITLAQEAPIETKEGNPEPGEVTATESLDPMTIVGSKIAAQELPGSAAYLDERDIRVFNYNNINRVLRQVPGVYIREEDGFGNFPNISIRGVDPTRSAKVTVMEDGLLTAPAPYSAPSAYYTPNLARMSGLEVLKGSSQIKYGPHITGGAINYLSTPVPSDRSTYLRTYYGSYNEFFTHAYHGDAVLTDNAGTIGYLFEGFFRDTDGFKSIQNAAGTKISDRDDTGFTRIEPMVKIFWEPDTQAYHRFEAKYGFTDFEADETYLGLSESDFDQDPTDRYPASRFDNIDTEHHRTYLRHIMKPQENLQFTTTGYYAEFQRDWFKLNDLRGPNQNLSVALMDTTPGGGLSILKGMAPGTLRVRHNNREYELYGVDTQGLYEFDTGELEHDLEFGFRYHYDEADRYQWDEIYTQDGTGAITGVTVTPKGEAGDRVQQTDAFSFFAQDRITWDKLTVTPGIRYEHLEQEYEENKRKNADPTDDREGDGSMDVVGGGVGFTYDLTPQWRLLTGVYSGYSTPSPRSAIRNDLDEERSLTVEAGPRFDNEKGFNAEAIYFFSDYQDLIVEDNITTGVTAPENVGDIDVHGLELALRYNPSVQYDWSVGLPMSVAFTYTDATFDGDNLSTDSESLFAGAEDGNEVPYIPEFQITSQIGVEYGRFGIYALGTYVDDTFTTGSNTTAQVATDGTPNARFGRTSSRFILDLTTEYQFTDHLKLFGGIRNLTDKEYVVSRHPHGPRTGLPRSFYVGMEVFF